MADKYPNFEALSKEKVEGRDYRIVVEHEGRSSALVIIAPHAYKIEPGTSVLAREIAGDDYCLYLFEGILEGNNFAELHITSTNFEEPRALEFVSQCITSVAIHGRRDEGDPSTIWLGGLNAELVTVIESRLREQGFIVSSRSHRFAATNPRNISNRTLSGRGVQIEAPRILNRL